MKALRPFLIWGVLLYILTTWIKRPQRSLSSNKRTESAKLNKLINQLSKTPKVSQPKPRKNSYIKNKMKGRVIANSMSIRSASKSFNKQNKK